MIGLFSYLVAGTSRTNRSHNPETSSNQFESMEHATGTKIWSQLLNFLTKMGSSQDLLLTHSPLSGRTKKAEVNISTVGVDVCDWIYPKKTDFAFGRADNRPSIKFSTFGLWWTGKRCEGRGGWVGG